MTQPQTPDKFIQRHLAAGGCFLLTSLLLAGSGCRKESSPPPLYPAAGRVVYRDGKPVRGGIIEFRCETDPSLTISADIVQDGSFTLATIHGNRSLAGAIAGECQVSVTPPFGDGELPEVIVLAQPVLIQPQANRLTITLPKALPQ